MTRINLVPIEELCDQHLLAEWRELPRMASFAARASHAPIPEVFTLGTGHMRFFLNKGPWLEARHRALTAECLARGFKLSHREPFKMPLHFGTINWQPTPSEIQRSFARILERMPKQPRWKGQHGL